MGWFLWRKPNPGFSEVQEIPLLSDVVFLGRGKDCTVHCLSLYVSRRHLKLIPKDDGSISLQDLGSSNGTFVNQTKITPDAEFPLRLGDEIGIGNFNNDNKDCFVYEVRNSELSKLEVDSSSNKHEPPIGMNQDPRRRLERGLKRFADEPEIVVLDDENDDENGHSSNGIVESLSNSPKRPKIGNIAHPTISQPAPAQANKLTSCPLIQEDTKVASCKDLLKFALPAHAAVGLEQVSSSCDISEVPKWVPTNAKTNHSQQDLSSNVNICDSKCDEVFPQSSGRAPTIMNVKHEISLQKPANPRVSAILEGGCDSSTASSPAINAKSNVAVVSSTPLHNKHVKMEDMSGLTLTPLHNKHLKLESSGLTPCVIKTDEGAPSTSQNGADLSTIVKDSSRLSQGSSANYTLDEELIPIDISDDDDDDEIFPCSQMFMEEGEEEDVKPCLETLDKEMGMEEEPQNNILERDDDVVLISDDEDEDEIQEANKWFNRLSQSQSFIKVEADDEISNTVLPVEQHDNDIWEDWPKDLENNDLGVAEPCADLKHDQGEGEPLVALNQLDSGLIKKMEEDRLKINHVEEEKDNIKSEKKTYKKESKDKSKAKDTDSHSGRTDKKKQHRSKEERHNKKHSSRHRKHDVARKKSRSRDKEIVKRLKKTFGGSSSEDDDKAVTKSSSKTQSDINFDALFHKSDDKLDLSGESKKLQISLNRLEENPRLCERYGLSSLSPSSPQQPSAPVTKKVPRKLEIVDALPNPPRRASNRGISMETSRKMYDTVRRRSTDEPKHPKSKEDSKALRKEKLAKVAAQSGSKDSGSAEHKRSAPAKAKVTIVNRGSFLTESDESSPTIKPKSRKEILDSIKIPKLKDKPVVNLPSKSPLQALNMSYEKKEPPPTTVQSHADPTPVEIPTGPQPKKRVAQKPPPGFYDDTRQVHQSSHAEEKKSLPVPAEHSLSMKSCLSGSSKHNITMNDSKPIARKKKRVQFKENLEEFRYIAKLPNTRPVNSSRDADRPTPMSRIIAPKLPKGPAIPNDDSVLQDVIYDISKWNPLWLKEEKDLPPDVVPPVVSNMVMPALPKTEFLDFHEYYETMYPLLMLELWSGVSREYNTRGMNEARNNLLMAVDKASSAPVFSRPERMMTTLTCHMLVNDRPGAEPPRLGNLVIIDLALKDPSGKPVIIPVFGYVSFDAKDRLRNTDQFHKDLVSHCRNPTFKIRFNLQIKERKNFTFVLERPMRIKHVKYLRGDLRMFQAMKNLEYTPLQYSVISPLAASEDFTLPDVSQKTLAFAEQLNPMQTQIVLQTAEVCLQDKPKICLIQGPPGTGKTQVIESLVMHLLYRDRIYSRANRERNLVPRILLCAPSNNAVDLLVARLLRRRAQFEKERRFKMVRVGQTLHEDVRGVSLQELANVAMKQDRALHDSQGIDVDIGHLKAKLCAVENQIRDLQMNSKQVPAEITFRQADLIRRLRVLEERKKQQQQASTSSPKYDFAFERETKKKILRGADIIGTTLNSCVIKLMETVFPPTSAGKYHFQVCIVDEATQCLEVETLIPLLLGVKTLVLVGDPNQLPATILSKVARDKGLSTSLFARLQNVVPKAVQMLDMQYRMHPEILKWPNKYFYHRRLKCPEQILSCRESRVLPYSVLSLPFHQDPRGESNSDEAKLVLQLCELLIDEKVIQHDFRVGIVTPYQSQRRVIESMLMGRLPKLNKPLVEVSTIDSCQGQEKDIIIISCVRTNGVGFLSDRQRINVALTRAKYAMFICGNFSSLDRDSMWSNLLSDARHRKCLIEVRDNFNKGNLWSAISKK